MKLWHRTILVMLIMSSVVTAGPKDDDKLYTIPESKKILPERLVSLIGQALNRPEVETRLLGLIEVEKHALADLAPRATEMLNDPDQAIRMASIAALRKLRFKQAEPMLLGKLALVNNPLIESTDELIAVDRALAEWRSGQAMPQWINRVNQSLGNATMRVSAVRALSRAFPTEQQVLDMLKMVVSSTTRSLKVRIVAAETLGELVGDGLESMATRLMAEPGAGVWMAVCLLAKHESPEAVTILTQLASNPQPAVQARAMETLLPLNPAAVVRLAVGGLKSYDPKVRAVSVQSLVHSPTEGTVRVLGMMLSDPHLTVRRNARLALRHHAAQSNLAGMVQSIVSEGLAKAQAESGNEQGVQYWRRAEQVSVLAGEIDFKATSDSLIELAKDYPHLETREAATAAVMKLKVPAAEKGIIDAILHIAGRLKQKLGEKASRRQITLRLTDDRIAGEIAQVLGVWRVASAVPVLKPFVFRPANDGPPYYFIRIGSIWALGLILEGQDDPDKPIAKEMASRLNDWQGMEPEAELVREACAIALGRLRSKSQLSMLKKHDIDLESYEVQAACQWSISQITGQKFPPYQVPDTLNMDSFIVPLKKRGSRG